MQSYWPKKITPKCFYLRKKGKCSTCDEKNILVSHPAQAAGQHQRQQTHVNAQFSGVSEQIHGVAVSNSLSDQSLTHPRFHIGWVQRLCHLEGFVSLLEKQKKVL